MPLTRALPRRDLIAIIGSLAGVTLLAWLYLGSLDMSGMAAMQIRSWSAGYFLMMFLMWAIMMVGMMLPSVAPTVLIFAAVARTSSAQGNHASSPGAFVCGYLVMWVLFSLLATVTQWGLDSAALLSPMMVTNSVNLGAFLLIATGVYQWFPIKDRCLRQCRSPVDFIATHWRAGRSGAFRMRLSHGSYCLGCCWVLMGLLFVGGVMNLLWITAITVFVLLEKILPLGEVGGRVTGLFMIAVGGITAFMGT